MATWEICRTRPNCGRRARNHQLELVSIKITWSLAITIGRWAVGGIRHRCHNTPLAHCVVWCPHRARRREVWGWGTQSRRWSTHLGHQRGQLRTDPGDPLRSTLWPGPIVRCSPWVFHRLGNLVFACHVVEAVEVHHRDVRRRRHVLKVERSAFEQTRKLPLVPKLVNPRQKCPTPVNKCLLFPGILRTSYFNRLKAERCNPSSVLT